MADLPRMELHLHPGEKKAICRCGQSQNLPFCDGSHHQHNAEHQCNLHPIVISCSDEA